MIIAGVDPVRGGGAALIRDDRLEFAATGDVSDPQALQRLLAGHDLSPADVAEWARPGAPRSVHDGQPVAGAIAYPRAECRMAAAWCTSPFAANWERSVVLVHDTDTAPMLYAVSADGRWTALPPAPFGSVEELGRRLGSVSDGGPVNLCLTGDRALDPSYAGAVRILPEVKALWVPPFPDVTGDATGAAALHLAHRSPGTGAGPGPALRCLDWRLRSGAAPARAAHVLPGWIVSPCRPEELARMLYRGSRPALVLHGRAKLGPYALGSRSILAPATRPDARARLGALRGDPDGTTVTALCLERYVPDVFDPGIPDPYVRFEHRLRPEWADRLPALAGAPRPLRVQTVGRDDDPTLAAIVREYHKWSGIPVLCATDADPGGAGPLPDVAAALRWGAAAIVWSDNILYRADRQEQAR